MSNHFLAKRFFAYCSVIVVAACSSVKPSPITHADILSQSAKDRVAAQHGIETIASPITLEEAIARALKYNLGRRTKSMEEMLALQQLDVSEFDMLPKLLAQAGYSDRNSFRTSRSTDSVTGAPSLANPSISSDKSHHTTDLGLSWNALDFGMSYLTAHQNADRVLIAAEYRRKAMHLLSQDVIGAFWRTASAQKLSGQIKQTILQSEEALADARRAEQASARSPIEVLKYQRQLLDNLKTLEGIRQDLSNARIELANLLNIPLVVDLRVIEPAEEIPLKILSTPLDQLEEIALLQNGDVREQYYNVRIASNEARKGILRLFPSVSFNYGTKYDSDSYLINNQWKEAGLQISFNIFNLLSIGSQNALGDARIALEEQRRITLQMGQLAKVHIARLQYASSIDQFNRADAIWDVDNKISNHMESRARAQTIGSQENISNKTAAVVSLLKRYDALSKLYAASGKLQATLGMEPNIGSVDDLSLNELTNLIKQWFEDWQAAKINLPQSELTKPESSISSEYALDQAK